MPRLADSNGLIEVKLKWELKYRGYVYFKPVRPNVIYQTLNYLKTQNRFYEEIINYSGIDKHQDVAESIQKKISKWNRKWFSWGSTIMHKTGSSETALVSEFSSMKMLMKTLWKCYNCSREKLVSILSIEFCEEQAFPYLLLKDAFGYKAHRDI